jgi:hypothetical protein
MNWVIISAVAETVAAFGVIGSLMFVGFQVQQNNAGLKNAAVQSLMSAYQDMFSNTIDSGEVAEILWEGSQNPEKLEGPSLVRFYAMMSKQFRIYQGMHWQWQQGTIDDGMFQSISALFEDYAVTPGWQHVWQERRHQYEPEFRTYIDTMMAQERTRTLYPGLAAENAG